MVVGLSLAFAGSALAATISCGQCHGAYINDNHGGKTLMPGVSATEDTKTPQAGDICNNNGRGLHGIHMNYSSVSYGKTGATRGNCNYCHNKHVHENGFVEMSGYSPASAIGQVGNFTITNGGTGYVGGDPGGDYVTVVGGNGDAQALVTTVSAGGVITGLSMGAHGHSKGSGYTTGSANISGGSGTGAVISITSITNNGYRQSVTSAGLVVSGPGMTANGLDITQMTGNANCATACHKGTSATNTAPWGNFTTPSIHLTCNSCHGDASNYGPTASNTGLGNGFSGTGGHKVHLYSVGGSHGNQLLGGTKIVLGSFSTVIDMNGNSDKVCAACHPDNTNDLWSQGRADDGSKKAYPHATDGTNVQAKNANFAAPAGIVVHERVGPYSTPLANCHAPTPAISTSRQCRAPTRHGRPAADASFATTILRPRPRTTAR